MTIRIIQVSQLESRDPLIMLWGKMSIWDYWGQKVVLTKNSVTHPYYIA